MFHLLPGYLSTCLIFSKGADAHLPGKLRSPFYSIPRHFARFSASSITFAFLLFAFSKELHFIHSNRKISNSCSEPKYFRINSVDNTSSPLHPNQAFHLLVRIIPSLEVIEVILLFRLFGFLLFPTINRKETFVSSCRCFLYNGDLFFDVR